MTDWGKITVSFNTPTCRGKLKVVAPDLSRHFRYVRADGRNVSARVQAAFTRFGALPPPAPRARILARVYGACARCAANARKATIVQAVMRQSLAVDVIPDVFFRPVQQRTYLV